MNPYAEEPESNHPELLCNLSYDFQTFRDLVTEVHKLFWEFIDYIPEHYQRRAQVKANKI